MTRALRAALALLLASFGVRAHAQVCSESQRCVLTIGSPGRYASIGAHRMLFANGELVWPSFVDVHVLDIGSARTRTLPHCGTAISDVAVEGSTVYMLADHAVLCRVSLTGAQSVQMLVNTSNVVIGSFAVSSRAFAYAMRRIGEQPEVRVLQWGGRPSYTFATAVTADHIAVDATHAYWIEAGVLIKAAIATGAKTVGPTIANNVVRMQVARGIVYVATNHEVQKLDAAGTSWVTLASQGADDLAVDGTDVYWASTSRGTITKLAATNPGARPVEIAVGNKPYTMALDASTLFFAEESPFAIKQVVPR